MVSVDVKPHMSFPPSQLWESAFTQSLFPAPVEGSSIRSSLCTVTGTSVETVLSLPLNSSLSQHNRQFRRGKPATKFSSTLASFTSSLNSSLAAHPSSDRQKSCHSFFFFFLIQPLFICLTFFVSTLHQDSSALPLTQKLNAFPT